MSLKNLSVEPLDANKITAIIATQNQVYLSNLEIFSTIDSTNQYLLEKKSNCPSGWACFAEQQTQGRGRRGRSWFSPPGANIYFSLLWRFAKTVHDVSGLSVAIGVIVTQVLQKYGIEEHIQLKWPNDILIKGRKLAGILLEKRGDAIVMGIGINLSLPKPIEPARIDIAEMTQQPVARNYLAGLLLNELLANIPLYQTEGLTPFISVWQQHDYLAGKKVTVHLPDKIINGTMCGITATGELLLQDEENVEQRFSYGEVSVRC